MRDANARWRVSGRQLVPPCASPKASQRLEQALARCAAQEQALKESGEELQELRGRVSLVSSAKKEDTIAGEEPTEQDAAGADGEGIGGRADEAEVGAGDLASEAGVSASGSEGPEANLLRLEKLEQDPSALERRRLVDEQRRAREVVAELEQRSTELEDRLAEEQNRARGFYTELEAARGRVAAAEKHGDEAMAAAATEASRAAEVREALEEAEVELRRLRSRQVEWEEESSRVAELKVTLEMTRDTLDEVR